MIKDHSFVWKAAFLEEALGGYALRWQKYAATACALRSAKVLMTSR